MKDQHLSIGSTLTPLQVEPVSRKTLALFAGSSGDHQPSHIDIDAARAKGRDDVIAHGMLTMAYLGRLLTDNFRQQDIRAFSTRFLRFTPVHGQPTCTGTVTAIGNGVATIELTATLADGAIVAKGEAQVAIG